MIADLITSAASFGWVQWLAFIFNVIYVILAAKENIWCWFFGFIGVSLLFVIYLDSRLFSDALLQVFYMIMSVYGWVNWSKQNSQVIPIRRASLREHLFYITLGIFATFLLGFTFSQMQAAVPYADAFTSAFAVIATFLVARKTLENWIYWIVIDTVCVGLYWHRQLSLLAVLFAIYTILAVVGWIQWHKHWIKARATNSIG
ncbi:MAG: nicotinamide mononucleotide transporter [Saprospiraceae bacterium]|nr:nicotinamide mononucleotide transporter [Saprospiraceae bacterium]